MIPWAMQKKYPWEGENEHWIYLNVGQNKVRYVAIGMILFGISQLKRLVLRLLTDRKRKH